MTVPPASGKSDELLNGALSHAPEKREAFLASVCGDDLVLLNELRSLLKKHQADRTVFLGEVGRSVADSQLGPTIDLAPPVLSQRQDATQSSTDQNPTGLFTADPDASTPVVFGRRIAQGGMGAILEGSDRKLGRTIAVKVMLPEGGCGEEQMRRFVQEAAVLGKLEHPNIVPIHDLGRDSSGQLYYTMKLVNGRTLQDILDDLRSEKSDALAQYNLDRLLAILRKVCDGLAFAHSHKIIHRDLKPANLMVGEFGEVLVMDWGLAKVLDGRSDIGGMNSFGAPDHEAISGFGSATMDGTVMGTPNYMSPEQAMGKVNEMDARSDIFSLGGILYAILTLRPPVEGKNLKEVLEKVKSANITSPTTFGVSTGKGKPDTKDEVLEAKKIKPLPHIPAGRVPASLSAVAMKALALEKEKRYQDVATFSADIEAYQNGFATMAEQAGLGTQLMLLVKRHKGIFSTAAAAWLLIMALAGWFVFNLRAKEIRAVAGEQRAEASAAEAKSESARATAAEAEAVKERETARQALAKSQLDLAEKEFERGQFVEAQKILGKTPDNFRDANWRFLHAHSRDFTAQLSIPGKGSANRLQFLPQGDRCAVRCWGDVIGIFSVTGRQIGDWIPVSGNGFGIFGLDGAGNRMAFPVSASEIAVQEVPSGQLIGRWNCEPSEHKNVILSPDGETVLVASASQLFAYAAQTGAPLWSQSATAVIPAFSPDGRSVAVLAAMNGLDLEIQLLDTETGDVTSTLEATADNPEKTTLQFNQSGDRLACLGGDEVILWNPKTSTKIRALHFPGERVKLLSPRGDAVATVSNSRIRLWDTTAGRLLRSFNGASTEIFDLAFSPDNAMLLSSHVAANDSVLNVWPTRLGEAINSMRPATYYGSRVVFNRDGSHVYACAANAGGWESRSGLETWKSSASSNDLRDLAVHPTDGSIILSEFKNPKFHQLSPVGEAREMIGMNANSSLKFNRSGQFLLTVAQAFDAIDPGSEFSVLEYPSGKELRKISFEMPGQPFATFCLEDAAVATAALAGGITLWDWQSGTPLRRIAAAETGSIACLAASPDGTRLATGGPDRWIRVWEAATGLLDVAYRAHWEGVRCVKFSHDGREILCGSEDGTVRIHDATNGEEKLALYGLTTPVADVDLSADGTLVAAITTDGFTQVWDRQLSNANAVRPKKLKRVLPKDSEGWEDLLGMLTEAEVVETGDGWNLKDGELFSPDKIEATLQLPDDVSGISYKLRVKLRQNSEKCFLHVVLPVAERMCGFDLEGSPGGGIYTSLVIVNGKYGQDLPGAVEGKQVKDTEPHVLEITVLLDAPKAIISSTLDGKPLYDWAGPTSALSQHPIWATTEPGFLALGSWGPDVTVSEVKLKRLPSITATPSAP